MLRVAPGFRINVTAGDSLLHGRRLGELNLKGEIVDLRRVGGSEHVYRAEDLTELNRILGQQYHVVVGNPPYITVKDQALNQAYRNRYSTCHRQYSLAVPFTERFFELAVYGQDTTPAGYVGMITANSFMKREFGKKLIEEFLPRIDLTHVIDASGAYIPGHGTPTVILFGRNCAPVSCEVRAILGIRGEPGTPDEPAQGQVWQSIVEQLDRVGSQNEYVSIMDMPRRAFARHPWSIGGGGVIELKNQIENVSQYRLESHITEIGRTTHTGEDEVFYLPASATKTLGLLLYSVPLIIGENVRDWQLDYKLVALFPYSRQTGEPREIKDRNWTCHFWLFRTTLKSRMDFGNYIEDRGLRWFDHSMFFPARFRTPLSIAFAFVATHNHFVLDRGGRVFKQSAPIIKLPSHATEDDHLALLGLLNSSTACFWMQQVFHNKGGPGGGSSKDEKWHDFYESDSTKLKQFPLPLEQPLELARTLDTLSQQLVPLSPTTVLTLWHQDVTNSCNDLPTLRVTFNESRLKWETLRRQMISLQEELDWQCYWLYGLLDEQLTCSGDLPSIAVGERAFEIVMAQKIETDGFATKWFDWLQAMPITEIPAEWPDDYCRLIARRIELIQTDRNIGLIEQTNSKRRWETEAWESQLEQALRNWLLDRLEGHFDFDGRMNDTNTPTAKVDMALISTTQLADIARQDTDFMQVGELYRNDPAFDVHRLVAELIEAESVPLLPVLRYKDSGLRKRRTWEQTWDLQRQEDAIDARTRLSQDNPEYLTDLQAQALKRREIGDIPLPLKYTSSDFVSSTYWRLRGKLDVPKERWVSFPHCEGADGTLMIAWAGYDHLQLARAISAYYVDIQERLGGRDDPRLVPLLACLVELLPWLKQWHNDVDPEFGMHMGDYFEGFIQEEARQMGKTLDQITAWEPPKKTERRRRKTTT
jgi:hypothetical protein